MGQDTSSPFDTRQGDGISESVLQTFESGRLDAKAIPGRMTAARVVRKYVLPYLSQMKKESYEFHRLKD